jgi:protein-tyrosine phosphatase
VSRIPAADRHLDWEGCCNARDLGGLRTTDGRTTRWGAVVRSERPDELTPAGWQALAAYGVRTIVDLRNDHERQALGVPRPAGVTTVHVPLDDRADTEFWERWSGLDGTPLFFRPFLDRQGKAERCAAALSAIAGAAPGGVLVHCVGGRDRTGLICLLLLALVGVDPEEIADDYELSDGRLRAFYERLGFGDVAARVAARVAEHGTTVRAAVLDTLAALDAEARMRAAGLGDHELAALRGRLLDPPPA